MYRALATANLFASQGWDVTVLTATLDTYDRTGGSDPESISAIDERVRVVRVPFDPPLGQTDLARWSRTRVFSTMLWNGLRWLRSKFGFPEAKYGTWRRTLVDAARQIHARHPVDLTIGTANPNVDFAPGFDLHRRFDVSYVMDHRDAWHVSVYTGERIGSPRSRSARLERRMFRYATEGWFVNEPLLQWHAKEYPERAHAYHVVANGYDPAFVDSSWHRVPEPQNGLDFGYLGTIYGPMPLREALEGWRRARGESELIAKSRLNLYGRLGFGTEDDPKTAALLGEFASDSVIYRGPVSKTGVNSVYSELDALVLLAGPNPFTTSGKVFEYVATGLPIAGLFDPASGAARILEHYPRGVSARGAAAGEFKDTILRVAELAVGSNVEMQDEARKWATKYERSAQLLPRIRSLRSEMEGRRD